MSKVGGRSSWWPPQRKARQHIRDAVRRGHIEKPSVCDGCGEPTARRVLSGHHADYEKRMRVSWLCPRCHTEANRRKGERVNQYQ
jgi:ribosomal protein L37AE/L43A